MNNTKWQELRLEMYELRENSPQWRTRDVSSGFISMWDGEWFYHFEAGGFNSIEWVEIKTQNISQHELVKEKLQLVHVPGHEIENGFRVYGYINDAQTIDYI